MRQLLIFVDSERPDPYLNSVVYNLRLGPLHTIAFVHVHGFPGDSSTQLSSGLAKRILTAVLRGISMLAKRAEYVHADGSIVALNARNGSLSAEKIKSFYAPVEALVVDYQSYEIHYNELRQFLRQMRRDGGQYVLDVTGCRKRFFGDFVALGLVDGIGDIRTFDLLVQTDFAQPWKSLIHELSHSGSKTFEYVDILETRIMISCSRAVFIRAPRMRYASALALALAALGILLNWHFGLESEQSKWVNVLAQFATFAALFFVFFPPRNS